MKTKVAAVATGHKLHYEYAVAQSCEDCGRDVPVLQKGAGRKNVLCASCLDRNARFAAEDEAAALGVIRKKLRSNPALKGALAALRECASLYPYGWVARRGISTSELSLVLRDMSLGYYDHRAVLDTLSRHDPQDLIRWHPGREYSAVLYGVPADLASEAAATVLRNIQADGQHRADEADIDGDGVLRLWWD